ncbi:MULTISPECIES: DUF6961 family protein [unclassified Sphingopyxis]|uniref:DUF6961 family protein n=1 Tax=unclassified Sphingopyxis TaxID=2614943 RepID=UPI003FA703DA
MGSNADHDLWGQVLALETRYRDRGPAVITDRIQALRASGEHREAEFWSQVAECLNDLHAIRYFGGGTSAAPPAVPPSGPAAIRNAQTQF